MTMAPEDNQELTEDHLNYSGHAGSESAAISKDNKDIPLVQLTLQNVSYSPITASATPHQKPYSLFHSEPPTRTTVLHQISTTIVPYQVAAWMGPSGSGKTSLLTVAANLFSDKQALSSDSSILINNEEGELPKRLVGVVWQDDLLLSNLTVKENVWYAARLKTPQEISDEQVDELVQATLRDLGLEHVQDSLVGGPQRRGVSGGERKRCSIASELVIRPSLLFLDEPTSGLDSSSSLSLMQTLQSLARTAGHSIVTVIHQPRTEIFNHYLDHLVLLSKGRMVYQGPPSQVRPYLEDNCPTVTPLPPETGIADWLMDVIKQDEHELTAQKNDSSKMTTLPEYWKKYTTQTRSQSMAESSTDDDKAASSHFLDERARSMVVKDLKPVTRRMSTLEELDSLPKYNASFWRQFRLMTKRTLKQQRGDRLTRAAFILQGMYLFATCLFWWRMPDTTEFIFQRNSLFFFMIIAQSNGVVTSAVTVFSMERTLLQRERAKKMYGVAPYFLAKTVSDLTNNVLLPVLYTMVVYWVANYRVSATAFFRYIVTYYATFSTAQSMGLAISVAIPQVRLALILSPPITLFSMILGGFYIPFESMHPGIQWASWLSFCRYSYSALIINEYEDRSIECADDFESAITTTGTGSSTECPLPGEAVIDSMGIKGIAENFWWNIAMLFALQLLFRVSAYVMLRRSKK